MNKVVLAVETSQTLCGAAVYITEKNYSESILCKERAHASMITEVIDSALKQAGVDYSHIGAIAVSSGPGSFTGLRIGLTVAKAMAFSRKLPLIMVPTFRAVAAEVYAAIPAAKSFIVAQKANSTEFYAARYLVNGTSIEADFENVVYSEQELKDKLSPDDYFIGSANWFAVEKYVNLSSPKPSFVARWAVLHGLEIPFDDLDEVEPLYLKDFVIKKKVDKQ